LGSDAGVSPAIAGWPADVGAPDDSPAEDPVRDAEPALEPLLPIAAPPRPTPPREPDPVTVESDPVDAVCPGPACA